MFDKSALSEILETERDEKRNGFLYLRRLVIKKLGMVRNLLRSGEDFSEYGKDAENIHRWLTENFPRLEETAKNDLSEILHMGRIYKRDKTLMFYNVFCRLLKKTGRLYEKDIDEIFRICNENGSGIDIRCAKKLPCLLRIAVCVKLCEYFSDAAVCGGEERDLQLEIENLFFTLDNLLEFCDENVLKHNAVEKILAKDPAGVYESLTENSKNSYRNNLSRLARREKKTELELAEHIVNVCRCETGENRHIGAYLCDKPSGGRTYFTLLIFLSLLFTTLLCIVSPLFILLFFSIYGSTKLLLDKIYNRFILKEFCLPRVKLSAIPDGHGVMVVITTLLTGDDRDDEVFSKLEKMYFSNGEKNVYFGVLGDLCDSDEEKSRQDERIINSANEKIIRLRKKYGDVFFLFVREREYSESEEKYIAPERKRGAVAALTELLCMKNDAFSDGSIKPDEGVCKNISYIFTLDSDTNLAFDCLKKLVGIMLHPQNKPYADKESAVVTKGYGILQPGMNPTLSASGESFFSAVMCGHGGVEGYSTGRFDSAMSFFGRSIFCGKGMFEKNCFYTVLCHKNAFRENSVLSHDAPEGARLRCAYVPDVTLTDSFPSEALAYYKRLHRWIRGDVQNLPFIFRYVGTANGGKIRNRINYASRFFMWQNIYSCLLPIFTAVVLCLSSFCERTVGISLATVALSTYMLPLLYTVFSLAKIRIWQNIRRRYFSDRVYTVIWTAFLRMLLSITDIVKEASVSLDAIVRSSYRCFVSHKKTLEWTTASQNDREKRDGLLGYVKKNLVSAVLGAFLFVTSPFGFVKIIALMWLFMPVFAYHAGKKRGGARNRLSKEQRETLVSYCGDMWRFFSENVGEKTNFLPTDNISLYPERKMSRMTSPTNIGFYLLSAVCARHLGFIDSKELDKRLCETLMSVDSLEKYDGLLYNWYDIFKKEPMKPMFVSSVDLGNYAACLICVKEALEEFGEELANYGNIKAILDRLLCECDLSKLYDKDLKLFYIGGVYRDGRFYPDRNKYDMLMSEARILSFVAVAQRSVPSEHYARLSRRFVKGKGYMGLASWSGTAFEFFLPEVFVPSKEGSLVYEARSFAYSAIRAQGVRYKDTYVFGISESCYNEFDDASNYKYHAFGLPNIALDVFEKQNVVSPYSSFLCLPFYRDEVFSNLERLKRIGSYGEYGFYESLDFERCGKGGEALPVKCFMSHHVGMSIAAAMNVLSDFQIARWFGNNEAVNSALELCEEKIPYDAYIKKTPRRHYTKAVKTMHEKMPDSCTPSVCARLSDGKMSIYAKRDRLEIKHGELLVSRKSCFGSSLGSFSVWIDADGEVFPFDKRAKLVRSSGKIKYHNTFGKSSGESFEASLSLTLDKNTGDIVRMKVKIKQMSGRRDVGITCNLSFYPLLDTKENGMVCSFFDEGDILLRKTERNEIYFRRNSRNNCFFAGVVTGKNKMANIEQERVTVCAQPVMRDGVLQTEFAFSLSDSKRCAEMGFVRCTEKSFDEACEELKKRNASENNAPSDKRKSRRMKDVLGYSMVKEIRENEFPVDSKTGQFRLMCGKSFCALAAEKQLGTSFAGNINSGRITAFSGVSENTLIGEKLTFDAVFDLCQNSVKTSFSPYSAIYEGEYKDTQYRVTAFVSGDLPCKIICVETHSKANICLELVPHSALNKKKHIGSGLVFFEGNGDSDKGGFAFGFCREDTGSVRGAQYSLSDGILAGFEGGMTDAGRTEYVFCIGYSSEERAFELHKQLVNSPVQKEFEKARQISHELVLDEKKIPDTIKKVLSEYFVFPENGVCTRALVCTAMPVYLFDSILLLYTNSSLLPSKAEKIPFMNPSDSLSRLLVCLFVSEYFRISGDDGYLEIKRDGETLYRRCHSYLSDEKENRFCFGLYLLCLECFSDMCDAIGDIRTAEALRSRRKAVSDNREGGIFL